MVWDSYVSFGDWNGEQDKKNVDDEWHDEPTQSSSKNTKEREQPREAARLSQTSNTNYATTTSCPLLLHGIGCDCLDCCCGYNPCDTSAFLYLLLGMVAMLKMTSVMATTTSTRTRNVVAVASSLYN